MAAAAAAAQLEAQLFAAVSGQRLSWAALVRLTTPTLLAPFSSCKLRRQNGPKDERQRGGGRLKREKTEEEEGAQLMAALQAGRRNSDREAKVVCLRDHFCRPSGRPRLGPARLSGLCRGCCFFFFFFAYLGHL